MEYRFKTGIVILFLFSFLTVSGQNDYSDFYEKTLKNNNTGMLILGSWALTNIATGAIGWHNNANSSKYFHQMNFFWNLVNLSIAGASYYYSNTIDIQSLSQNEIVEKHKFYENLFLINAGLDVLYMGTGYYLNQLSKRKENRKYMLKGYGNSIALQGGFLLIFDAVMYGVQRSHRIGFLENLSLRLEPSVMGIQYSLNF